MVSLRACLGLVLRFVEGVVQELFKGMFGAVLWLFSVFYGLFKGMFGASFKVCLRDCLGIV